MEVIEGTVYLSHDTAHEALRLYLVKKGLLPDAGKIRSVKTNPSSNGNPMGLVVEYTIPR